MKTLTLLLTVVLSLPILADDRMHSSRAIYLQAAVVIMDGFCQRWHAQIPQDAGRTYACELKMKSDCAFNSGMVKDEACAAQEKVVGYEKMVMSIDLQLNRSATPRAERRPASVMPACSGKALIWSDGKIECLDDAALATALKK